MRGDKMTGNELVRLLGVALSHNDKAEHFRQVQWHHEKGSRPAYLEVDVRDGSHFSVTVNEVK